MNLRLPLLINLTRFTLLILVLLLPGCLRVQAQEGAAGIVPLAGSTQEQLQALQADLDAGQQRVAELLDAVDVTAAEAWLEQSDLDTLRERAIAASSEADRAVWQQAVDHEQTGAERIRGGLNRAGLALAGLDRLGEAQALVETMIASFAAPAGMDLERNLSQIEQEMNLANSRRAQIALDLNQRNQLLARLEEEQRVQEETMQQALLERERELAAAQAPGAEETAQGEARQAVQRALERSGDARIITAALDAQSLLPRIERLRLEVRTHALEDRWLQERQVQLQAEFNFRSTEEVRQMHGDLLRMIDREPDVQRRFADQVAELRQQIDQLSNTQDRIRLLQLEREAHARNAEDLRQTLADVRERLEIGGLTETLGGLFLEEQRSLRAQGDRNLELRAIGRELSQARLRNISLREQLRETPVPVPAIRDDSGQMELRRLQYQALSALVQSDENLSDQLRSTEAELREVVVLTDELDQILQETLIWWPSHTPVGVDWSKRIPAALLALLNVRSWQEIYDAIVQVTVGRPAGTLFTISLAFLLYYSGLGTGRHLRHLAERTRHRFSDNMKLTFKAMGWSFLRVMPIPVLLMITAYRLEQVAVMTPNVELLAAVLFSAGIWLLAGHLFLIFSSRNGVGTVHFEWNPLLVRRLRLHLAWYLPTQFVLIICLALSFAHPDDLVFDVLGRVGIVAVGALTGIFAWRLLAPYPDLNVTPLVERRRRLLRMAMVVLAVALVTLSLAGYLLTVRELLARTIDTAVVIGLVWLGYRLAGRALVLSETRLRIRRMREERAKMAKIESNSEMLDGMDLPAPHLSTEDINQQTRALLKVCAGGVLILALFWVWADILPALTWLDNVTMWSRTIVVNEVEDLIRVSLQDFGLAVFLTVLFTMAARNLPGLVEVLLARTTEIDPAGRYTVAMLLRYMLIVVTIVTGFSLLGLRWSELQWMVAALTLGLGFGLQEVVANFVSGLIMLFERPVRVGDTITIGEYSGTVLKIRTRATTVMDWDNREVVVPNKAFITERLINWTLTDTITRIVVPVGVSYKSDVDLVMATLQEIAEQHPMILKDPEPSVLFLKFGESTLNFELRTYVNQLRDRMSTISELHQQIIKVFRERGVEIALPQMDLHIRDQPTRADRPTQIATSVPVG